MKGPTCLEGNKGRDRKKWKSTYYVHTIRAVLASASLLEKILAIPKSELFGFISLSNNTLEAFRSRWVILSLKIKHSLCNSIYNINSTAPIKFCSFRRIYHQIKSKIKWYLEYIWAYHFKSWIKNYFFI